MDIVDETHQNNPQKAEPQSPKGCHTGEKKFSKQKQSLDFRSREGGQNTDVFDGLSVRTAITSPQGNFCHDLIFYHVIARGTFHGRVAICGGVISNNESTCGLASLCRSVGENAFSTG